MTNTTDERLVGDIMAHLIGVTDDKGEFLTDRLSVSDLWTIINHVVPVVRRGLNESGGMPPGLTPAERTIWLSPEVRVNITAGRKIVAIKEARTLTGMSLKETKDFVEKMQAAFDRTGSWLW